VVPGELVARLCETAPAVLLDQAYVDFAEADADALPLLDTHPNLVIFRTLSKAFSAAGFRIGYAVARPELAVEIGKAVLPFSVDLAAEELALAVLENAATSRRTVGTIVSERERVAAALRALGAEVAGSSANFLFFRVPGRDGVALRAGLLTRGVLVRDMTSAAPGRLRVTIGTPDDNDTFLHALEEQLR
jgi:histidinol-phosphate aminotransferase